ncbi:hypothetical protein [Thalassococcus sp. S3]|uniref:hypothetical protein n=1 Tax=Thalassococcus sp. S3 TaxID=2017482 RepID=UPI00102403DA|nr:hypothetical protein [Thalassococcus sp. S3]QBF33296.1 hypothetical protein CFI11_19015 [Thalassococcus sp. S3]
MLGSVEGSFQPMAAVPRANKMLESQPTKLTFTLTSRFQRCQRFLPGDFVAVCPRARNVYFVVMWSYEIHFALRKTEGGNHFRVLIRTENTSDYSVDVMQKAGVVQIGSKRAKSWRFFVCREQNQLHLPVRILLDDTAVLLAEAGVALDLFFPDSCDCNVANQILRIQYLCE